eukprot:Em0016g431a
MRLLDHLSTTGLPATADAFIVFFVATAASLFTYYHFANAAAASNITAAASNITAAVSTITTGFLTPVLDRPSTSFACRTLKAQNIATPLVIEATIGPVLPSFEEICQLRCFTLRKTLWNLAVTDTQKFTSQQKQECLRNQFLCYLKLEDVAAIDHDPQVAFNLLSFHGSQSFLQRYQVCTLIQHWIYWATIQCPVGVVAMWYSIIISLKHWTRGVPATFELIVTSLIPLSLPEASVTAGTAALMAEQRKHQANGPKCYTLGLNCIPLAVQSYGN